MYTIDLYRTGNIFLSTYICAHIQTSGDQEEENMCSFLCHRESAHLLTQAEYNMKWKILCGNYARKEVIKKMDVRRRKKKDFALFIR
jgi:hypothetical protein